MTARETPRGWAFYEVVGMVLPNVAEVDTPYGKALCDYAGTLPRFEFSATGLTVVVHGDHRMWKLTLPSGTVIRPGL